jgi:hypothetical protein
LQEYKKNIWDQSLTYGHYNLHDTSLLTNPIGGHASFFDYCWKQEIVVLAAAPLSMGLLTCKGPPEWHPAPSELKQACHLATDICQQNGVDISTLALLFTLSNPQIPTTILGMCCIDEVKTVHSITVRLLEHIPSTLSHEEILRNVLSANERKALESIRDIIDGPFAALWNNGLYQWEGVQAAHDFWKLLPHVQVTNWQNRGTIGR